MVFKWKINKIKIAAHCGEGKKSSIVMGKQFGRAGRSGLRAMRLSAQNQ
jgi:hypothetical protein